MRTHTELFFIIIISRVYSVFCGIYDFFMWPLLYVFVCGCVTKWNAKKRNVCVGRFDVFDAFFYATQYSINFYIESLDADFFFSTITAAESPYSVENVLHIYKAYIQMMCVRWRRGVATRYEWKIYTYKYFIIIFSISICAVFFLLPSKFICAKVYFTYMRWEPFGKHYVWRKL